MYGRKGNSPDLLKVKEEEGRKSGVRSLSSGGADGEMQPCIPALSRGSHASRADGPRLWEMGRAEGRQDRGDGRGRRQERVIEGEPVHL